MHLKPSIRGTGLTFFLVELRKKTSIWLKKLVFRKTPKPMTISFHGDLVVVVEVLLLNPREMSLSSSLMFYERPVFLVKSKSFSVIRPKKKLIRYLKSTVSNAFSCSKNQQPAKIPVWVFSMRFVKIWKCSDAKNKVDRWFEKKHVFDRKKKHGSTGPQSCGAIVDLRHRHLNHFFVCLF